MQKILREALSTRGAQARLVVALGLPKSTVNNWATGKNTPEPSRWGAIEEALGLAPMTLANAAGVTLPADPDRYAALEAEVRRQGDELRQLRATLHEVERAVGQLIGVAPPAPRRSRPPALRGQK